MAELNSSPEKAGRKSPRKRLSTRVDLTAMVDLAFLLITFFMLTTTLQKPRIFELAMPVDEAPGGVPASRTLTLCIGSNHHVISFRGTIDEPIGEPKVLNFDNSGVRKTILDTKEIVSKNTNAPMIVLIKSSDKSQYGDLVNTLDELKIAGVEIYAVVDITPKDVAYLKSRSVY